jgi:7-cyano-7-deazaguanine synthase in queuosine biosynthesis
MIKQCLWSGGLDSTYMIFKLLSEGHHVDAYYIKLTDNTQQTKRELSAINKLVPLLSKFDFSYKGILSEFSVREICSDITMQQAPIWLLSSYYLSGPVNIGYVMNDDSISYLNDYYSIISSLNLLRTKPLIIEFPLIKIKKEDIIKNLPLIYKKHITYCSSMKRNNCGICASCIRYKSLLKGLLK